LQIDDCTRHYIIICQGIGIFKKQTLQHKIVQGNLISTADNTFSEKKTAYKTGIKITEFSDHNNCLQEMIHSVSQKKYTYFGC
jgi:hypothetical protein